MTSSPLHLARPLLLGALALVAVPLGLEAPDAIAAPKSVTVTGQIPGASGYTVLAVRRNGTAVTATLGRSGRFRLVLKRRAAGASLQLVGPKGRYFGPVILGRTAKPRRALQSLGRGKLPATVKLGTIRLKKGYAELRTPLVTRLLDRRAVARVGVAGRPLGAGRIGYVKMPRRPAARAAQAGPPTPPPAQPTVPELGADTDQDGIPNNYDVDDDGDGVLDAVDTDAGPPQNQLARVFNNLKVSLEDSLNANGSGVTEADIDRVTNHLWPTFEVNPFQALPGEQLLNVNIDCPQVSFCRRGDGTATVFLPPMPVPGHPAGGTLEHARPLLRHDPGHPLGGRRGHGPPDLVPAQGR